MRKILIFFIRCYQTLISPMLGPHCRYYPSCSSYAQTAIERFGAIRGSWLAVLRVCRCHPWHPGGEDPVPEHVQQHGQKHVQKHVQKQKCRSCSE